MEAADGEKLFSGFEVTAAHQETELIGWCSEASGQALDRQWEIEILLALHAVEHRWGIEGVLFNGAKDFHPGHGGPPLKAVRLLSKRAFLNVVCLKENH